MKNIDIDKIIISNKVSFGNKALKYFIGYKGDDKVNPLYIIPPKMNRCRCFLGVFFDKKKLKRI